MLHRQLPGGAIGVDLAAAVEVLLDVAYAVQYLHSLGLVHGDVKVRRPARAPGRFPASRAPAPAGGLGASRGGASPPCLQHTSHAPPQPRPAPPRSSPQLENILLKSDHSRILGVTPKLADFGLTKILNEADHTVNLDGAGTVTHLAPGELVTGFRARASRACARVRGPVLSVQEPERGRLLSVAYPRRHPRHPCRRRNVQGGQQGHQGGRLLRIR
jgi:serine/threonine protein kinase